VALDSRFRGNERILLHRSRVVASVALVYITLMVSLAQRIILADHARLPWRFFGQLAAVRAGL
jgi:hypothetical protein